MRLAMENAQSPMSSEEVKITTASRYRKCLASSLAEFVQMCKFNLVVLHQQLVHSLVSYFQYNKPNSNLQMSLNNCKKIPGQLQMTSVLLDVPELHLVLLLVCWSLHSKTLEQELCYSQADLAPKDQEWSLDQNFVNLFDHIMILIGIILNTTRKP